MLLRGPETFLPPGQLDPCYLTSFPSCLLEGRKKKTMDPRPSQIPPEWCPEDHSPQGILLGWVILELVFQVQGGWCCSLPRLKRRTEDPGVDWRRGGRKSVALARWSIVSVTWQDLILPRALLCAGRRALCFMLLASSSLIRPGKPEPFWGPCSLPSALGLCECGCGRGWGTGGVVPVSAPITFYRW